MTLEYIKQSKEGMINNKINEMTFLEAKERFNDNISTVKWMGLLESNEVQEIYDWMKTVTK